MSQPVSTSDLPNSFNTPRLVVRAYRPGDGAMYYAVGQRNRAHLQRYEAQNSVLKPTSAAEGEALIGEYIADWQAGRYFMLGAFSRATGEFVGQIYIGTVDWHTPEFEVGYFVDCQHQGQGYITEALQAALTFIFQHLGAHRVRLDCSDTNLRSLRVAEYTGFVREAWLRENRREPDGSYSGTLIYGLLRDEYKPLTTGLER